MKLRDIASFLGCEYNGDDKEITGLNTLDDANDHELSFLDNPKYEKSLRHTRAGAVLIKSDFVSLLPDNVIALVTNEPYLKLAHASKLFALPPYTVDAKPSIVDPSAVIAEGVYIGQGAKIEKNVVLMPHVVIGDNCVIGEGTLIYPNVTVYRDCSIGKECIIHANSVIGSDGFGFAHTKQGEHVKIYQNGNVIIEDDVEIGANVAIDRAVFGSTIIKKGVKIDNLVQIGHNCLIGEYSIIVSQTGISGSSTLGRNVVMGGQSASAGHLSIGAFATIAARGGVTKSIEGGKTYAGFPLLEHREWLRLQAKISGLKK